MIEIKNLNFSYGNKPILKQISCGMSAGKIYGILGKNGSGKTTLFRNIFDYLKPNSGTILMNGSKINKEDISFLETHNYYYPFIKGREHLELISKNMEACLALANVFDLPLEEYVDEYSTGMKKKLSLIACLSMQRKILLLDEPFNGVDLMSNELILNLLEQHKKGKIIILSSHILSTLTESCDEILVLENGQLTERYTKSNFDEIASKIKQEIKKKTEDLKW